MSSRTYSKDLQVFVCILAGVIGLATGCNLAWLMAPKPNPQAVAVTTDNKLVKVTILERLTGEDGNHWWLLETEDGQRGYVDYYVGKPGDKFALWSDKIGGYRLRPSNLDPISPIVLPKLAVASPEAPARLEIPKAPEKIKVSEKPKAPEKIKVSEVSKPQKKIDYKRIGLDLLRACVCFDVGGSPFGDNNPRWLYLLKP